MNDAQLRLRNCNFKFRCTQKWQLLEVTSEAGVRFCPECQKDVHLVKSSAELHEFLKNDFCIAIPFEPNEEPWDDQANHLIGMITSIETN